MLVASAVRSQPSSVSFSIWSRWPGPPGTMTTSGAGTSAKARSATSVSVPVSLRTGPGRSATNTVSAPGVRASISWGPTASSAVKRSKRTMAICMGSLSWSGGQSVTGRPFVIGRSAAGWGRKRLRYSVGAVPSALTNARRIASGVP